MPENIQNTEFGKQAASVWQSTAENPRKIENTADERSKDILSKHHTYIEALKTDLKDLIETGDFYKASERLGDIRLNQQMFDERIGKTMNNEMQPEKPENNVKFDVLGQPETAKTYEQVLFDYIQITENIKRLEKYNDEMFGSSDFDKQVQENRTKLKELYSEKRVMDKNYPYLGIDKNRVVDLKISKDKYWDFGHSPTVAEAKELVKEVADLRKAIELENQIPTVIASEQSERGNLPTTESETPTTGNLNDKEIATNPTTDSSRNDGLNSGSLNNPENNVKFDALGQPEKLFEPHEIGHLMNELRKDFAEIIELSQQENSREKWQTKQEETLNLLKAMRYDGIDIKNMPIEEIKNPVIEMLINKAETEPYAWDRNNPDNSWNKAENSQQRQPETVKTYDWYQQQIKQVDEKINDAKFEAAKQPENQDRQQVLQKAIDQKTALELECQYGVSSPKLVELQNNIAKAEAYNSLQTELSQKNQPHDLNSGLQLFNAMEAFTTELNAEKQKLPNDFISASTKKLMETVKETITKPSSDKADIENKLGYLNNAKLVQDLGLNHKEIQTALTEALSHKNKNLRLMAVNHSQMQDKWLQKVIDKHRCPDTVKEAQKVLQNRQSETVGKDAHPTQPTAEKGGFSLSVGSKKQAVKATKQASMDM